MSIKRKVIVSREFSIFRNVLQLLHANIGDLKDDTGKPPRHIDGGQPSRLPYKTVSVSRLFAVRAVCYLKLGMLGESFPYPKSVSGLTEGAWQQMILTPSGRWDISDLATGVSQM